MLLSTTLGFVYHDILADQRMPEFPENIFSTSLSTTVQLHTSRVNKGARSKRKTNESLLLNV